MGSDFDLFQPAPEEGATAFELEDEELFAPLPDPTPKPEPPRVEPLRERFRVTQEERADFKRWLQARRFVDPQTQRRVPYQALPYNKRVHIRDAWLREYRDRYAPQLVRELPEGAETVKQLDDFQKGDLFFEAENMKRGPLIIREIQTRPGGAQVLVAEDGISYGEDEVQRHVGSGFLRLMTCPVVQGE